MKRLHNFVACFPLFLALAIMVGFPLFSAAQDQHHEESTQSTHHGADTTAAGHSTDMHADTSHGHAGCHFHEDEHPTIYDATATAFHHISDANVYSIGSFNFPLPCILYAKGHGWDIFSSSRFDFKFYGHGEGHKAYNRYVLDAGAVKRIVDTSFPDGEVALDGFHHEEVMNGGEKKEMAYACYGGKHFKLDAQSTADGGLFGGAITSFYDFSLSKNVVSMLLISGLLAWAARRCNRNRQTRR